MGGTAIEITQSDPVFIEIGNELYSATPPLIFVRNLFMGNPYFDVVGKSTITRILDENG